MQQRKAFPVKFALVNPVSDMRSQKQFSPGLLDGSHSGLLVGLKFWLGVGLLVNWFSENKNRTSDLQCLSVPVVKIPTMASFNSHRFQPTRIAKFLNINKPSGWLWPVLLQVFLQILCQEAPSTWLSSWSLQPTPSSKVESSPI